jgi:hypothetical protein
MYSRKVRRVEAPSVPVQRGAAVNADSSARPTRVARGLRQDCVGGGDRCWLVDGEGSKRVMSETDRNERRV